LGKVQPLYTDTYTFYTYSDDGVRLWVNGQLIIDNWENHKALENKGTIKLEAGVKYDIKLQYFESTQDACISLLWSSMQQSKQVVPKEQLYPDNTLLAGSSPFDYAIFSNNDLFFNGINNYVSGSVHANANLYTVISIGLTVTDQLEAKRVFNNRYNNIGSVVEDAPAIPITNVPSYIQEQLNNVEYTYPTSHSFPSSFKWLDGLICVNGNAIFDAACFSGKGTLKATGDIIFNGSTNYSSNSDDVCFYSENGNIIINGWNSDIHGTLYAPNGCIIINGIDVTVHGRVIADQVAINGHITVVYKDDIKDVSLTSGNDDNLDVLTVNKDMNGNVLNNNQAVKVKFFANKDVDKMKINLNTNPSMTLPDKLEVKNIDRGTSVNASVVNGCIQINDKINSGHYEIQIPVINAADGQKISFNPDKSIVTMDENGVVTNTYKYDDNVLVRYLKAGISSATNSQSITAFRNSETSIIMDFELNRNSTDLAFNIGAEDANNTAKDLAYKVTKLVKIESGGTKKEIAVGSGGTIPATLDKGVYKAYITMNLPDELPIDTNLKMQISKINLSDDLNKNLSFGPYNGSNTFIDLVISTVPIMQ
jgi:hypothetical protein